MFYLYYYILHLGFKLCWLDFFVYMYNRWCELSSNKWCWSKKNESTYDLGNE